MSAMTSKPADGGADAIAVAINRLADYAHDLDATERPAIGEYDVTADIRAVCEFAAALIERALPATGRVRREARIVRDFLELFVADGDPAALIVPSEIALDPNEFTSLWDAAVKSLDALSASPAPQGHEGWRTMESALRQHWLTSIKCDEANGIDTAHCYCTVWKSEPCPNVGAAVDAWIAHVIESAGREIAS